MSEEAEDGQAEKEIFDRIMNEIVTLKNEELYDLREELRFYELENKSFLVHTRKKLK